MIYNYFGHVFKFKMQKDINLKINELQIMRFYNLLMSNSKLLKQLGFRH